jgi:ubiquinone/menaquinone biosynthesis C-methylase UbiE
VEPAEYDAMYQLEDNLWWYQGQAKIATRLFERYLPRTDGKLKILDCGAGSGGSLRYLRPLGEVTGFDITRLALDFYLKRQRGRVVQASVESIPFADAGFDMATLFDVLACVDSPEAVQRSLVEVARVVKPGGYLFWREPAFMFLHGPHDVATHAYHRFTKGEFADRLQSAGFTPRKLSYSNSILFPVAAARRLSAKVFKSNGSAPRSDVRPMPEPLNSVLARVLAAEAPLVSSSGLPAGLSVLALAQKR